MRSAGFTLVEVLVALAIVAFGLTALFTATSQTVQASAYLREKTLAQWIALNRITEARLEGQPPADEEMSGDLEYAGQTWRWELKTIETPVAGIVRLEARAALEGADERSWPGFATGFMGDAMAPPGAPSPNWLGEPGKKPPGQRPPGDEEPVPLEPTPAEPEPIEPEPEPPEEPSQ
ncbi:MAG TPA: type II secretion system minor pseudopilin GspI [Steroidobacteraceae bacterium]|nr:type II secretion system minor pseudopilin GspI [Steroidobacteraceae bacterium]